MVAITKTNKQGRNELCSCGSGIKYKKCCGRAGEPTMRDVLKCLYLILDMINKQNIAFRKGLPVEFPKAMLNKVPDNFIEKIICQNKGDRLVLFAEQKEKPVILTPGRNIIF